MIDIFKTEGKFPTSLPGRHFNGPIRSRYRPRRLWTLLTIVITSCLTLPPVFNAFYSLFCSGFVNIIIGVVLLGLGNTHDLKVHKLFANFCILFYFFFCSDCRVAQVDGP